MDRDEAVFRQLSEDHAEAVSIMITGEASKYFRKFPSDFCIHSVDEDSIAFGDENRLMWSPSDGFTVDEERSTKSFIDEFKKKRRE